MDVPASDRIAEEQAALRRVAVLVAGGVSPEDVFGAVTAEVRRLMNADMTAMARYDPDRAMTYVARWSATGDFREAIPRTPLGGRNVGTLVFETGRPARMDDLSQASGPPAEVAWKLGIRSSVGVPVSVEGRLWGVMFVSSTGEDPLPPDAEARLADFTELVGAAIASAQARVGLRGYADEQAALRRVATLVASGAPPEEVFAAVAAEAGRLLGADETAMARYDLPDEAMTTVALWSATGATLEAGYRTLLGGQNVSTLVFRTGRPTRMDDLSQASGAPAEIIRKLGIRSSAGVPISVEGRLWGVMTIASTHEECLPADTEARLAGFTELVGTAIANAQARVEVRGYADEQAALRRVATLAAGGAPPAEVFAAVTEEVGRVLAADFASMSRYDVGDTATAVGMWTRTKIPGPIALGERLSLGGQNVTTLVYQTRQPARIDDYGESSGEFADVERDWGFRAAVGAPITVEGRLWGVMTVGRTCEENLPADTEARLVGFTELVGTTIANVQMSMELRRVDDQDGLLLRVYIPAERLYAEEMRRLTVLFCDLLTATRKQGIRQSGYRTAFGETFEFFADATTPQPSLREDFYNFPNFLELCAVSPATAVSMLSKSGIGQVPGAELVARFGKEWRRIEVDLRHDRERRVMTLRHSLEGELLETGIGLRGIPGGQIDSLLENLVPFPSGPASLLAVEAPRTPCPSSSLSVTVNQQIITAMAGAVIRNVQGTAHLGAQAQDIIALIDRFGDRDAPTLRAAAQQLEDPDAPPAVRAAAQEKLKSFLRLLAGKAEDIALSLLEKYIESKIGA